MPGKTFLLFSCALWLAAHGSHAAEKFSLTGWAEFGGVARAVIIELPESRGWIVRSDREVAGFRLERLDATHGRAWVRHGADLLEFSLASSSERLTGSVASLPPDYIGPWPEGYEPEFVQLHRTGQLDATADGMAETGHAAAGRYIGALRAYARTLPEAEKAFVERELSRYSAGDLRSIQADAVAPAQPAAQVKEPTEPRSFPSATAVSSSSSLPNPDTLLLERVLSSPPPQAGSLIGLGVDSDLAPLRRLFRVEEDPTIRLRLCQQLDGYSAPPIANYVRNEAGEWTDPADSVQSGG